MAVNFTANAFVEMGRRATTLQFNRANLLSYSSFIISLITMFIKQLHYLFLAEYDSQQDRLLLEAYINYFYFHVHLN